MRTTRCFSSIINRAVKLYPRFYSSSEAFIFPSRKLPDRLFPIVDEFSSIDVRDYLKKRGFDENVLSAIPESFFKRTIQPLQFLLIDRKVAKLIALTVCARSSSEYILEFDAGIGLVSEVLLPLTENLNVYVASSRLAAFLEEKFRDHPKGKLKIYDRTFVNILGILYSKVQDPTVFHKLMEGLPLKPWTADISWSAIMPILHLRYLKALVSNLLTEKSLKQFGRPEFFFLMPTSLADKFLTKENCPARNVAIHFLFNMFFDAEVLLSDIPREEFLPWRPTLVKNRKAIKMTDDYICVIHAVPKVDRFEPFEDHDFLDSFLTFVKSALRIQKRVIPTFELFVPNCGPCFIIEDDLTIYTTFSELTPEKFYHLFKKLSSYPEFDSKMLLKLSSENNFDDNVDENVDENADENETVNEGEEESDSKENASHD